MCGLNAHKIIRAVKKHPTSSTLKLLKTLNMFDPLIPTGNGSLNTIHAQIASCSASYDMGYISYLQSYCGQWEGCMESLAYAESLFKPMVLLGFYIFPRL